MLVDTPTDFEPANTPLDPATAGTDLNETLTNLSSDYSGGAATPLAAALADQSQFNIAFYNDEIADEQALFGAVSGANSPLNGAVNQFLGYENMVIGQQELTYDTSTYGTPSLDSKRGPREGGGPRFAVADTALR